ncbi:hypothetical protein [Microbacterium sp.]|uniref:hypothetical protein n=1 Tax=Microbacterium sp. TaxID=51671 RepID=UPI002811F12E|nr:hypothetical protein [Microbacterium sp.]
MARVGGRNIALSWVAGIFCAGVVAALLWLALPIAPVLGDLFGEVLRRAQF